jgi:hypothetical protein
MFGYELGCLNAAQQFGRIASYVARYYFIGDYLSFGGYDEGSAFRHSVRFYHDIEIPCESACRICEHGIFDFLNGFGRVVL